MKPSKPSAASRTVDLFAAPTLVIEDVPEVAKVSETIEVAAERWRANAFYTQEHLSKGFANNVPETAKYRITTKDGWSYLEQFRLDKSGGAYHYSGLMYRTTDQHELTNVMVKASKGLNQ